MSLQFLIGAIIGSGLFIFVGGQPARKLAALIRQKVDAGQP